MRCAELNKLAGGMQEPEKGIIVCLYICKLEAKSLCLYLCMHFPRSVLRWVCNLVCLRLNVFSLQRAALLVQPGLVHGAVYSMLVHAICLRHDKTSLGTEAMGAEVQDPIIRCIARLSQALYTGILSHTKKYHRGFRALGSFFLFADLSCNDAFMKHLSHTNVRNLGPGFGV